MKEGVLGNYEPTDYPNRNGPGKFVLINTFLSDANVCMFQSTAML